MTTKTMLSAFRKAIEKYDMIDTGDKIAVGLSGGKDSVTLLTLFAELKKFYPKEFSLAAINIDMGLNADEKEKNRLFSYVESLGVPIYVEKTDIGKILFEERKEKSPCSLCSKMRRGALCSVAGKIGANTLALGHHADDVIETLLLSMLYESRISTFPPVTKFEDKKLKVIRPLVLTEEKNIRAYAKDLPLLRNPCPADKHTKRQYVKEVLDGIKKEVPFVKKNVLSAITHPERTRLFPPDSFF